MKKLELTLNKKNINNKKKLQNKNNTQNKNNIQNKKNTQKLQNKIIKEGGSQQSKAPYVLKIKKIKKNKDLINDPSRLEFLKNFSPISGSELQYNPKKWNDKYNIKSTHNCYTYALGRLVPELDSKAQPGYASGYNHINDEDYDCKTFFERLQKDVPTSYIEKFDKPCLKGFYKIFLALDPKNDYHWWRQNKDKYWSHKPGSTNVVDVDASGKKISNPLTANRNYDSLNYYKPCFFACVYSDLARSIATVYDKNI